jgi:epoxyqueuosine reductase
MAWIEKRAGLRADPRRLLEGCRTIISLAYPYPATKPVTEDGFSVSRYSQPDREDYHVRVRRRCRELIQGLEAIWGGAAFKICVDSVPIMERSFAYRSGVGFMGKNNMIIVPGYGAYLFLAEILTPACVEFDEAAIMEEGCGSCRKCIEACPTGALVRPYHLDASRCLSYLTIEHTGVMSHELGAKMGDCFFGCDRCQEVCPHNGKESSRVILMPPVEGFLGMGDRDFEERFGKTALSRAGLAKLKQNIRVMLEAKKTMRPLNPS